MEGATPFNILDKLGLIHKNMKSYDLAIDCYQQSLQLESKSYKANFQLGKVFVENLW